MRDGKILQQNTPEKLYKYPKTLFVGNFLGGLNILEGYVTHIKESSHFFVKIRLGGPKFTIYSPKNDFKLDENVIVAFRPEDVYLFPFNKDFSKGYENWNDLIKSEGEILETFLTGKEKRFIVELDNGDSFAVAKPEVFRFDLKEGNKIIIGLFEEDLRLFKYPKNLHQEMDLQ